MCRSRPLALLFARLRRFARCDRGAVMPLFLVSAGAIFAATLGGMDLARHASATTRLENALDGAALAMGRLATSESDSDALLEEARRYFEANFPSGYQGSGIGAGDLSLSGSDNGRVLTLSVQGVLPLLSTGFLDVSGATLSARSTVRLQGNPNLEIVFSKDTNSWDGLGEIGFSSALKQLGGRLLETPGSSVYIGTVPYTDVVKVGNGERQKRWVERWLDHDTSGKSRPPTKTYHLNSWSGCIAEPTPWQKPDLTHIRALTPDARFIPLLARVQTSLHEKHGGGKGWQLQNRGPNPERVTQYGEQPESLVKVATGSDRYFWSAFDPGPGNAGQSTFELYSLHEPQNCATAGEVRFLDNTPAAVDALESMADIRPADFLKSLPPAGLLWSWRMLSPAWRQGNGWDATHMPTPAQAPARAIVLITPGDVTSWDWLSFTDTYNVLRPVWTAGSGNAFHFRMRYHSDTCKGGDHNGNGKGNGNDKGDCHNGERYVREHLHNAPLSTLHNDWQRPVTSLAMANPFSQANSIGFAGWPTVLQYLRATCDAIKNDGVNVFVLSPRLLNWQIGHKSEFAACSSNGRVYSLSEMNALEQTLLNLRSESTTLRLVPSP